MPATPLVEATLLEKKTKFFGGFLITSLIGVSVISIAVYQASSELQMINEIHVMNRMFAELLRPLPQQSPSAQQARLQQRISPWLHNPHYFIFSRDAQGDHVWSKKSEHNEVVMQRLADLESTRVDANGGYFAVDDTLFTWVQARLDDDQNHLWVVHAFNDQAGDSLSYVYKKRVIVPVIFYLWAMAWVTLLFNHLLKKLAVQQGQMSYMALHDTLTGLPNRSLFEDRVLKQIQVSQRQATSFAVAVIDLDGFKGVNDRYGHAYGDEILKQSAARLQDALRESDTAARHGGDEFVLLIDGIGVSDWQVPLGRVHNALIQPYSLFDTHVEIGASIGVAIYPNHGSDLDDLLHSADVAMYTVKLQGGGTQIAEQRAKVSHSKVG